MKKPNNSVAELGVPKSERTTERINGFYRELGWLTMVDSECPDLTYVRPAEEYPFLCYWQTHNANRVNGFIDNSKPLPSAYCVGPSMPIGLRVNEVGLIVKDDLDVPEIWAKGGELLLAHAYKPLEEYFDTYDFRFVDPFGLAIRVTGDPGYEA